MADAQRRRYNVGAIKLPHAQRDVAHGIVGATDEEWAERRFLDIIGAVGEDDDEQFPVGSNVTYHVELTDDEAEQFRAASNCRYVELDTYTTPRTAPAPGGAVIPAVRTLQWQGAIFPGSEVWHGRDVTIAVLDQGTTQAVRNYMGWTLVGRQNFGDPLPAGDEIFPDPANPGQYLEHGCLVAPNLVPQGGRIIDCLVINSSGGSTAAMATAAARWAVDQGARVLNHSFGSDASAGIDATSKNTWTDALNYLNTHGAHIFFAGGNEDYPDLDYPAAFSRTFANVHSVGGFNEASNSPAWYTNWAADMTGVSPGENIVSLTPDAQLTTWNGTSAASPNAARLCARIMTGGRYSAAQAGAALKANMRKTGNDKYEGGGAYDLRRALIGLGAGIAGLPPLTNRVPNPSAEVDLTGWTVASADATMGRSNGVPSPAGLGSWHAYYAITAAGAFETWGPSVPVTPGETITASAYVRRNSVTNAPGDDLYLEFYDASGASLSLLNATSDKRDDEDNVWIRQSVTVVVPDGAATARPMLWCGYQLPSGYDFRVDGWSVTASDHPEPYFDGSTAGCAWTGTANASASTKPGATPATMAGLLDDFAGALSAEWAANGATATGGKLEVNVSANAGAPVYSSARSTNRMLAESQVAWFDVEMPAAGGFGQLWVRDATPADTVARLGFEYDATNNQLRCTGQAGASYAPIGTTVSLTYSATDHKHLRLRQTGSKVIWETSADGATWTVRRTQDPAPIWTSETDLQVSIEGYRTSGANDTLKVGSVNTGPAAAGDPIDESSVGVVTWAADYTQPDAVAAGYADDDWNRQSNAGDGDASGLVWPPPTAPAPFGRAGDSLPIRVPDGTKRYEVVPSGGTFTEGQTTWVGFAFSVDGDTDLDATGYQVIWQNRPDDDTGSPPQALELIDGGLYLTGGWGRPGANPADQYQQPSVFVGNVTPRTWHSVVAYLEFSSSPNSGRFDLWFDDVRVITDLVPAPGTNYSSGGTSLKNGIYHDPANRGASLWIADHKIGTGYQSVKPSRDAVAFDVLVAV